MNTPSNPEAMLPVTKDALEPCERCGESARVQAQNVGAVGGVGGKTQADERWCVVCWQCAHSTATFTTEAEAIAAWNTRAPQSERDAVLEEAALRLEQSAETHRHASGEGYFVAAMVYDWGAMAIRALKATPTPAHLGSNTALGASVGLTGFAPILPLIGIGGTKISMAPKMLATIAVVPPVRVTPA